MTQKLGQIWIRPYGIPSCITHRPLPVYQISLKWKKLFVDGRTYWRTFFPPLSFGEVRGHDVVSTLVNQLTGHHWLRLSSSQHCSKKTNVSCYFFNNCQTSTSLACSILRKCGVPHTFIILSTTHYGCKYINVWNTQVLFPQFQRCRTCSWALFAWQNSHASVCMFLCVTWYRKNLSCCGQTRATRLEIIQGHRK